MLTLSLYFYIQLDGNPALNLATFVTTYMEDEAEKLMAENLSKNFIDYEEYPQSVELSVSKKKKTLNYRVTR